jgi:apolipoprotein N-acyltransferase
MERHTESERGDVPRLSGPGLVPLRRFAAVLSTWVLLGLAQPGFLRPDGFGHLAFFALAPWAYAASASTSGLARGRAWRAFVAEWLAHALGLLWWFAWMRHLLPWLLVPMALVPAFYLALGGVLLRRLAQRFPLALAAPVAWGTAELVRWHLPPPLSFGWLRTGELMHDTLWLSGSARVWGVHGLTFVLGALGGLAADIYRARSAARAGRPRSLSGVTLALGVAPLSLGVLLALFVAAPRTAGTVGIVIAQPGIEQSLKGGKGDYLRDEYVPLIEETLAGVAAATAGGGAPPELVLYGESILPGPLAPPAVLAAYDRGLRPPAWSGKADLARHDFEERSAQTQVAVGALFGSAQGPSPRYELAAQFFGWSQRALAGRRVLPEGAQLLAGVEAWDEVDGELRRRNAMGLWDASGTLVDVASKVELVPGAEGVDPIKHFPFMLGVVHRLGGYVPDFVGVDTTQVLEGRRADGALLRIGATVCYDNAFDGPYTEPLRRGPVDLFVVASNEAWYRTSCAMDHLLAMARMRAISTGRPVVRATNSGISAVIGGDGRLVAVLTVGGARKMVRGHLAARVPLPADPAARTFFVQTERLQLALALGLAALLAVAAGGARGGNPARGPG